MYLESVGFFLPGEQVSNAMMEKKFGLRKEWIEEYIGTEYRHFCLDLESKKVNYNLADICTKAAENALENSSINKKDIDMLVLSTATPDQMMPATINIVADQLGLNNVATYQIQTGCSGALQGLDVASQFLASGKKKIALVIGADSCTKYLDLNQNFKKLRATELINYALFGDGAGAAIITQSAIKNAIKIIDIQNRFVGLGWQPGQIMNWFGFIPEHLSSDNKRQQVTWEDYKSIEKHVPEMAKETLNQLLESNSLSLNDVDYYMPPQLGKNMSNKIAEYLELSEKKLIQCIERTGNNGNALPYIQFYQLAQCMEPETYAVGIAIESSKWIKTGIVLKKEC